MPQAETQHRHIYGEVNSIKDIRDINRTIREEMDRVKTREQLTELKKRSDYLCTLTFSPQNASTAAANTPCTEGPLSWICQPTNGPPSYSMVSL